MLIRQRTLRVVPASTFQRPLGTPVHYYVVFVDLIDKRGIPHRDIYPDGTTNAAARWQSTKKHGKYRLITSGAYRLTRNYGKDQSR